MKFGSLYNMCAVKHEILFKYLGYNHCHVRCNYNKKIIF